MQQQYGLPIVNAPDTRSQLGQINTYLRQLVGQMNENMDALEKQLEQEKAAEPKQALSPIVCYPVGAIFLTVSEISPQVLFGGRWERLQDRFLLAAGDTYPAGSLGGSESHTLTVEELPVHTHGYTGYGSYVAGAGDAVGVAVPGGAAVSGPAGGGQAMHLLPPYVAVFVWKRTA